MEKKDEDLSMTFIDEVGQKSAVIDKEELKKIKPKEVEKKSHKKIVLYILLILFPFLLGIVGAKYFLLTENKPKEKVIAVKKKQKDEEVNPEILLLDSLIKKYDNYSYNIFKNLYSKKVTISSMDKDYREGLIFNSFLDRKTVAKEEVEKEIKLLFSDEYIEIEDSYSNDFISVKYESGLYNINIKDYEEKDYNNLVRKIVKAIKKNDNSLEVNVAVAIIIDDKVYKEYDEEDELIEVEDTSAKKFDIEKDYTKLNQYKYVFKYDEDNMNYYLDYIEKVK